MSEVEDFPLPNLMSDIGGDLSLYIGITTLTFCELGEFIIRIVFAIMSNKKQCRSNQNFYTGKNLKKKLKSAIVT